MLKIIQRDHQTNKLVIEEAKLDKTTCKECRSAEISVFPSASKVTTLRRYTNLLIIIIIIIIIIVSGSEGELQTAKCNC